MPKTVVEVGGHAFQSTGLTGLVLLSSCKLEVNAFANIYSMEFLYVAEGCAPQVGTSVFGYNEALTAAVLPKAVSNIKDGNFKGCQSLVIYTPAGSYAEQFAKQSFIQSNTDAYAELAAGYAEVYG